MVKNILKLRNVAMIACLIGITVFLGCEKHLAPNGSSKKNSNFHNLEYRTGLWINASRTDTLEFISSTELIRKGKAYTCEEYLYRIEENTLIISSPNTVYGNIETYHPILKVEKGTVVLGNMYITNWQSDNSGTFIKD